MKHETGDQIFGNFIAFQKWGLYGEHWPEVHTQIFYRISARPGECMNISVFVCGYTYDDLLNLIDAGRE